MSYEKKPLREVRLELKDILVAHDIAAFRAFAVNPANNFEALPSMATDEQASRLMHFFKSRMPYLGSEFQASRNFFRLEELRKLPIKDEIVSYYRAHGTYPPCVLCQFFTHAPATDKERPLPCATLGAIPEDIACSGFTPVVD